MVKLTIITPTYNRGDCLKDCWNSLKKQSCKDFQWLIVDDGSSDNTESIVASFSQEISEIIIDYVYKKNGGKHTALNESHSYIKGNYILILDSDDRLISTAVEQVLSVCDKYEKNKEVGQFIFLKGYTVEEPICYVEHEDTIVDTLVERRISIHGRDCCDVYRTDLFIAHPFPVFENERFIGEGAAFLGIELESKAVYINKVIYICEYREDGLTKAGRKLRIQNPLGGMYNSKVYMNRRLPIKLRIKKGILYASYSKFAKKSFSYILMDNNYKILTVLTYLPGICLYRYWKRKYSL